MVVALERYSKIERLKSIKSDVKILSFILILAILIVSRNWKNYFVGVNI